MCIMQVYPLIYVRTVLGADLGKVKKYSGMGDCIKKTVAENGVMYLHEQSTVPRALFVADLCSLQIFLVLALRILLRDCLW